MASFVSPNITFPFPEHDRVVYANPKAKGFSVEMDSNFRITTDVTELLTDFNENNTHVSYPCLMFSYVLFSLSLFLSLSLSLSLFSHYLTPNLLFCPLSPSLSHSLFSLVRW